MVFIQLHDWRHTMSNPSISIRFAELSDLAEIQTLFVSTISTICVEDYSQEQIRVWTASIENTQRWINKIANQYFLIAQVDNKMVGYASLENHNYLDFLYVHKDYQRQGIAKILYHRIEKEAIKRNATIIISDVSITAKPFFERKGFKTLEKQIHKIQGVEIANYKMAKQL